MIRSEAETASVEGTLAAGEGDAARTVYFFSFDRGGNSLMTINSRAVASAADWFGMQAIVSFATKDTELVYGAPDERRRFLDLFISLLDKEYLKALVEYRKNLALRNKLLKTSDDEVLFGIYEEMMAETGAIVVEKRIAAIAELAGESGPMYREISGSREAFSLRYEPGFRHDFSSKNAWKNVFLTMLSERRKSDRELGFSSCGPQRDDVQFSIDGKTAKGFASQGQCRSLVLSLKLGAMRALEKKSKGPVIILFDDAVSELDPERTSRVFSLIEKRGQLFIASPGGPPPISGMRHLRVAAGAVAAASVSGVV